jgi:hypothetical protein
MRDQVIGRLLAVNGKNMDQQEKKKDGSFAHAGFYALMRM